MLGTQLLSQATVVSAYLKEFKPGDFTTVLQLIIFLFTWALGKSFSSIFALRWEQQTFGEL